MSQCLSIYCCATYVHRDHIKDAILFFLHVHGTSVSTSHLSIYLITFSHSLDINAESRWAVGDIETLHYTFILKCFYLKTYYFKIFGQKKMSVSAGLLTPPTPKFSDRTLKT